MDYKQIEKEKDFYQILYEREKRKVGLLNEISPPKYIPGRGTVDIKDYWDKKILTLFV